MIATTEGEPIAKGSQGQPPDHTDSRGLLYSVFSFYEYQGNPWEGLRGEKTLAGL